MSKGKGDRVMKRTRKGNQRRNLDYYTVHRMNARLLRNGGNVRFANDTRRNRIYDTVTGLEI